MKVDAQLIRETREAQAWSQEDLAVRAGLNLRTIQRIEKTGSASLHSKRAIAAAFGLEAQDLGPKENRMSPCPECRSDDVYMANKSVDSTTIGGELLPKLSTSRLSSAKIRPVICGQCGLVRFYVESESLEKLGTSAHWSRC